MINFHRLNSSYGGIFMVKITKRTDYGLTLLTALAKKPETLSSLKSIATEYQLPYKFIGQVASALLDAGLITSKEGATGGYKLAKAPADINLRQVLEVLDGPIVKVDCLKGKNCQRRQYCCHHQVLSALSTTLSESLQHQTIADLIA